MDEHDLAWSMFLVVAFIIAVQLITSCAPKRVLVKESSCVHFSGLDVSDCEKLKDL